MAARSRSGGRLSMPAIVNAMAAADRKGCTRRPLVRLVQPARPCAPWSRHVASWSRSVTDRTRTERGRISIWPRRSDMDLGAYLDAARAFDVAFRGRWGPVPEARAAGGEAGRRGAARA